MGPGSYRVNGRKRTTEAMKEIGGYIELDRYFLPMLHENAIKLNCGRNALAYLVRTKNIQRILMPSFLCSSCRNVLMKNGVAIRYYPVGPDFKPAGICLESGEWLYVVNFYGQLSNAYIRQLKDKYENVILDQSQAYFQMPVSKVDTFYTCRKFFGVADGALLYTDSPLSDELPVDVSYERMHFLLGRFEKTASEFYEEYVQNNDLFLDEPVKRMSKLTENLLHGIDYDTVKRIRTENFSYLHAAFQKRNKLELIVPEGAFMYPLYLENGKIIRNQLLKKKIYIPVLWPDVYTTCGDSHREHDLAENILPLPVDQRYGIEDMDNIIQHIYSVQ